MDLIGFWSCLPCTWKCGNCIYLFWVLNVREHFGFRHVLMPCFWYYKQCISRHDYILFNVITLNKFVNENEIKDILICCVNWNSMWSFTHTSWIFVPLALRQSYQTNQSWKAKFGCSLLKTIYDKVQTMYINHTKYCSCCKVVPNSHWISKNVG